MKEFMLGLLALCGVIIGLFALGVIVLLGIYGFGWSLGWGLNYFIGPAMIFGITFPQLIGLLSIFSGMIAGSIAPFMNNTKAVEKAVAEKFKEYRGY
jgi:hypothetical protein